jgi:parallel beta-helix repeat protein
MKKEIIAAVMLLMLFTGILPITRATFQPFIFSGGQLCTSNFNAWGGVNGTVYTSVPFNVDAAGIGNVGLRLTVYGLNMSRIFYDGGWVWPPDPSDLGAIVDVGITGDPTLQFDMRNAAWFQLHSTCGAGMGTWNDQGGSYNHTKGVRSWLVQGWDCGLTGGKVFPDHPGHEYNVERFVPNTANWGNTYMPGYTLPYDEYQTFDYKIEYIPLGGGAYNMTGWIRMHAAASWDEMAYLHWPYRWQWNTAINNVANPEDAWVLIGGWDVDPYRIVSNHNFSAVYPYVTIANWGTPQTQYHYVSWQKVVIEGTPTTPPSAMYVNGVWVGLPPGTQAEPGKFMGYNAFGRIQDAINAATGTTIYVYPGTYREALNINKSLDIISTAGADQTFINGSGVALSAPGLVKITADSGNVTFSRFTVSNAEPVGTDNVRIEILSQSDLAGPTYTVSNNKIYGTNNASEEQDYGFYAQGGKENIVFTGNLITQTGSNNMVHELHTGSSEITYNSFDAGAYGVDPIFFMTYNGVNITSLQKVSYNDFDMGTGEAFDYDHRATGVSFTSPGPAWGLGEAAFTNMVVSGNIFSNLKSYRRGIGFWNAGTGHNLESPTITGNTIDGIPGSTASSGIDFYGLTDNTTVTYNSISNTSEAIVLRSGDAPGTKIHYNNIASNAIGVNWTIATSEVDARFNWWGSATGPSHLSNPGGSGDSITDNVDYSPWLGFVVGTSPMTWHVNPTGTIQEAINEASSGDTVLVHNGTYGEALYINKSLTIKAASTPIIQGSHIFATNYGNREAVIFVENATNVVLNGLDIEGQGFSGGPIKSYGVIYENSTGTVQNCTISPNMITDMYDDGIAAWSRSNLTVKNCTVKNFGRVGLYATNVKNFEVQGNKIIGQPYTQSDLVNYGIEIEDWDGASAAEIVQNEICNCGDSNPSMLWSSAGIIVDVWRAYYDLSPSNVSIMHNNIHNNFEAIEIVSNSMSFAHYNDIHDNLYGVWTDPDLHNNNETFDARFNWWGDASGPYQAATNPAGLGNDAGDYVDYSPWLGFVVGTSPMTWHINPTGGSDAFQEAIDEASDGDTIVAHAGTYYENQTIIYKSLTVMSNSGADTTIIDGSSATLSVGGLIRITATTGDVVFSGFSLRNAGNTSDGDRFGIYASSSVPGHTYVISYNKIYGTNNPDDAGDYGIYAAWGKEKLVFTYNFMTQHGSNPILIEVHTGETDVSYNNLDEGAYGSTVYFSMTHDGTNITTLQKVSHNIVNLGTGEHAGSDYYGGGIVFRSAYAGIYGNGTYTNVQITDNVIYNLKGYRRAIELGDDAFGDGSGGQIISPTIYGNVISGAGETESIGIRLRGLVTGAIILNNQINDVDKGIICAKGINGNHSPQATITYNNITKCNIGINITDSAAATVEYNDIRNNSEGIFIDSNSNVIEHNRIVANLGQFSGIHLTSTADENEIHYNCIVANNGTNVYGVYKEGGSTVNATYNWWGSSNGPYHPIKNPLGLGNQASDYVLFDPWLKAFFEYSPTNPVVGQTITFNATLSTTPCNPRTIVSYTWNFADGNVTTITDPTIVHAFAAPGNYNVSLTLTYDDATTGTEWAIAYVAREPYFKVEPESITLGIINKTCQINITINDLDSGLRAVCYEFRLTYNATLLRVMNVTEGPFLKQFNQTSSPPYTLFSVSIENNPPYGPNVHILVEILPNATGGYSGPFPQGNGTIATITFKAVYQEKGYDELRGGYFKPPLTCNLTLTETSIFDTVHNQIAHREEQGHYTMMPDNVGDLNWDGKVRIDDVLMAAIAFGSDPSKPNWNPNADINGDNKVRVDDLLHIALNFAWTAKDC